MEPLIRRTTSSLADRLPAQAKPRPSNEVRRWAARIVRVLPGLGVLAFALSSSALRRVDGSLDPVALPVLCGGIALTVVLATWASRWARFGRYLGLAMIGQASALALIEAPNFGVLQRIVPWYEVFSPSRSVFVAVSTLQIILAGMAAWRWRDRLKGWVKGALSGPQGLFVAGVLAYGLSNFSAHWLDYIGELVRAAWLMAANTGTLVLAVYAIPADSLEVLGAKLLARMEARRALPLAGGRSLWALAFAVAGVAAALAWFVFEGIPHIPDSVSFLFQAKYLSAGKLFLPAPPVPASLDIPYAINDGVKWYGYGFLGWPAILALGAWVDTPWLVNPIIAGVTVLLANALLRSLYGRSLAGISVFLLAVSPWFLFMSASYMTHPVSILWSLLALLSVQRARESGRAFWGLLAGLSLGALFLTRPLEGVLIGGVVGVWAIGLWGRRLSPGSMAALLLGAVFIAGLSFPYNAALTGKATYFPMPRYFDEHWYPGANRLGFGVDVGNVGWEQIDPLPGHGPLDVIINNNQNLYMLNFELFGWAFGSVVFVVLFVAWKRWSRADRLMLSIIGATIAGNSLYYFSGVPDFGARYWYQALVPMIALTVRGMQRLRVKLGNFRPAPLLTYRIGAFVALGSLVAVVNFLPWRSLGKYHHYRGMRADLNRLAQVCNFGQSLVFVREMDKSDYPSAFVFNPATLETAGTIYARDLGEASRSKLAAQFPGYPIWIVQGSADLGGPFSVVESPGSNANGPPPPTICG